MVDSYLPPVDQLLSLGALGSGDWLDYRALGLSDEHVPALVELVRDERLAWDLWDEGDDDKRFWAPGHAWRALGQLRAEGAADPLVEMLVRDQDNDWAMDEIPEVLGMIGPAALQPVRQALARAAVDEPEPWVGNVLACALKEIAERHPHARDEAIEAIMERLRGSAQQDPTLNAFLISQLLDLNAVQAAPVIEAAFAAGAVDEDLSGDWEDVQVELGLLEKRTTPPPRYQLDPGPRTTGRPARDGRSAVPLPPPNPAAKARSLRKAQKQAKRKRRR